MKTRLIRFGKIAIIIILLIPVVISLLKISIYYYRRELNYEISISPSMQPNTIWKTENDDLFFISGPEPIQPNNFHAYALWEGEYCEIEFWCDLGRQAVLAIPNANGIVGNNIDSIYLVVGTYHIKEDVVLINKLLDSSSEAFLQGRSSIEITRYSYDELIGHLPVFPET